MTWWPSVNYTKTVIKYIVINKSKIFKYPLSNILPQRIYQCSNYFTTEIDLMNIYLSFSVRLQLYLWGRKFQYLHRLSPHCTFDFFQSFHMSPTQNLTKQFRLEASWSSLNKVKIELLPFSQQDRNKESLKHHWNTNKNIVDKPSESRFKMIMENQTSLQYLSC